MRARVITSFAPSFVLPLVCLAVGAGVLLVGPSSFTTKPLARPGLKAGYGKLPLGFEAGPGEAEFRARGAGYECQLSPAAAELRLQSKHADTRVGLRLVGARAVELTGEDVLPGRVSYFKGREPRAWRTQAAYARVRGRAVYPGVDVVFYGRQRQLEYDFIVAPGAAADAIRLAFSGVDELRVDEHGDLLLATAAGALRQHKPVVYQDVAGQRRFIAGGYVLGPQGEVGFAIGAYDPCQPLVIDPVLSYATLLGGSLNDFAAAIAVDAEGSAYITGQTFSADFPATGAGVPGKRATFFKSEQGGAAWQAGQVSSGGLNGRGIQQFVIDPKTPATLYASTYQGIFKSLDRGVTWVLVNSAITVSSGTAPTLALDAGNPNIVYAISPLGRQVIKSVNGGQTWADISPTEAGSLYTCAADPVTAGTLYVTTDNGVYKTTDGGATWRLRALNGGFPNNVTALAFDPATPTIMYAALPTGVFKSTDSGERWELLSNAWNGSSVIALAVDPANPATLYAALLDESFAGGSQLFKSTNGGRAWQALRVTGTSLAFDARTAGTLYAGYERGVRKSTDSGATWREINSGLPSQRINALAVDPANPALVYAGTTDLAPDAFVAKLNPAGTALVYTAYLGGSSSDYGQSIAVDAAGNAYVYVNSQSGDYPAVNAPPVPANQFFASLDRAANWNPGYLLTGIRAFAFGPAFAPAIYVATNDGVFANSVADGTSSWLNRSAGLPREPLTALSGAAREADTVFAATAANETSGALYKLSNQNRQQWRKLNTGASGKVESIAVDPSSATPLTTSVYAANSAGGVLKSVDGGETWSRLTNGLGYAAQGQPQVFGTRLVVLDPQTPSTLYAATLPGVGAAPGLFKSLDSGDNWMAAGLSGLVTALVIDPKTPATLYAVATVNNSPGVFKSTDGGLNWQRLWPNVPGGAAPNITALAIDSAEPATLYAAIDNSTTGGPLRNGAYLSTNGGQTWSLSSYGLPDAAVTTLAVNPNRPTQLFAAVANTDATLGSYYSRAWRSYVTKLNPTGSQLVYSTAVVRAPNDLPAGALTVDAAGSAYVTGTTTPGGLEATPNAYQRESRGERNAFVAKLNPAGTGLVYATYLGGTDRTGGTGIAVDAAGNAYITGGGGRDFPTTPGAYSTAPPESNAVSWLAKLNANGSALVYSSYLPGVSIRAVAVDAAGSAYVTGGVILPRNFPVTPGAFQTVFAGAAPFLAPGEAFVTKFSPDGAALVYSTLLGGNANEQGAAIAVDAAGQAVVTGATNSKRFPLTADAAQMEADGNCGVFVVPPLPTPIPVPCSDAFLTRLNAQGNGLLYSTYLGGKLNDDEGAGVALGPQGAAYLTGTLRFRQFPGDAGRVPAQQRRAGRKLRRQV